MSCFLEILLVAETVHVAAVRALPGDAVARHAPEILFDAGLAYFEAAPAVPAEWEGPAAAVTSLLRRSTPAPFAAGGGSGRHNDSVLCHVHRRLPLVSDTGPTALSFQLIHVSNPEPPERQANSAESCCQAALACTGRQCQSTPGQETEREPG